MLRINGKVLTQDEIVRRLKISQGLPEDTPNEEVLIKGRIDFSLLENMSVSHPKVSPTGGVTYVDTFIKRFATEGLSYAGRWLENGVPSVERVELFDNETGDPKQPTLWYKIETSVVFHEGRLTLFSGEEEFLLWLRMHPRNRTNHVYQIEDGRGGYKFQPAQSPLFKEVIVKDETQKQYATTTRRLQAEMLPFHAKAGKFLMDTKQVVTMAAAYGYANADTASVDTLRLWLSQKAALNPEKFLQDYHDGDFELASSIATALQMKKLNYETKSRKFTWGKNSDYYQKGATKGVIAQLPSGISEQDAPISLAKKLVAEANHATINQIKESVTVTNEESDLNADIASLAEKTGIPIDRLLAMREVPA